MTIEEMERRLSYAERRIEELESRLKITEDIEEIKKLHNRYANALIAIDWDTIIDCFAEDGSIDVQFGGFIRGKSNIAHFFKEMLSKIHIGKEGIFIVHPQITIYGDEAKGNWLMYIMYADHRTWASRYWIQGIYDAEYKKVNGIWKFKHLQWRPRLEPPGPPPPTLAP